MDLKIITSEIVRNKVVLYRSPYDIDVVYNKQTKEYKLIDNTRIKVTLDTLKFLVENKCKILILTWVGRPTEKNNALSTKPHAKELMRLLNKKVEHVDECIGIRVKKKLDKMKGGDILMLENTRFHKEEYSNDKAFAKKLIKYADIIVYDGFPQAHREHSSTLGILNLLPSYAGFYMEKEYETLTNLVKIPRAPFTLIVGGIKISDKLKAVINLIQKADNILVSGGVANIFLKSTGIDIQNSVIEDSLIKKDGTSVNFLEHANALLKKYKDKIHLPIDVKVANSTIKEEILDIKTIDFSLNQKIPKNYYILDIGPKTIKMYERIIAESKTVFWNGPVGLYTLKDFSTGTKAIGMALSKNKYTTVASGGDTIDALNNFGITDNITHISVAGGATLALLAGENMEVINKLKE